MMTFTDHGDFVHGCDFHPTEPLLATIGDDGTVRLWDLETKEEINRIQVCEPGTHAHRVFFSADGSQFVTSADEGRVRFWETATGRQIDFIAGFSQSDNLGIKERLACSPDRSRLAMCDKITTQPNSGIFDFQTRERICTLDNLYNDPPTCLRFSADGRYVAGGTEHHLKVLVWSAETGELLHSFAGHLDQIQDLAFHPDGQLLASSDRVGVVRTWPLREIQDSTLSSDARAEEANWPAVFRAHDDRILSLDFSPDGKQLVTGSRDLKFKVWQQTLPSHDLTLATTSKSDAPQVAKFLYEGSELLINTQRQLQKWNLNTNDFEVIANYPGNSICMAACLEQGFIVSGYQHGALMIWDIETGKLRSRVNGRGPKDRVTQLSISPDGSLLAVERGNDDPVEFWDLSTGLLTAPFRKIPDYQGDLILPDDDTAIVRKLNNLQEYHVRTDTLLRQYAGHSNAVSAMVVSYDDRLLISGSHDRTVRIWNRATGECRHTIPAHDFLISSLAVSPDGRTLASGDRRGGLTLSHLPTGRMLFRKSLITEEIHDLEFSPNGRSLAIVQETGVTLLQAPARPVHAD